MLIQLFQRRLHCTASINVIIKPCITRIARPPKMRHHHGRAVEFSNRVDVPRPGRYEFSPLSYIYHLSLTERTQLRVSAVYVTFQIPPSNATTRPPPSIFPPLIQELL